MKKIYLLLTVLMTLVVNQTLAQNPTWSLAEYYRYGNVSPLPIAILGYGSDPAFAASNMQFDAQGNILFFVVADMVYKKGLNG